MNNKRGVSDIVVTILLVLLALAAVAIVWAFISWQLQGTTSSIAKAQACLNLKIEPISCGVTGISGDKAVVRYKLNPSTGANLTGVRVLIQTADGGVVPETVGSAYVPQELQTIVYTTATDAADAKKFSVAGTITLDNKDVFCDETSQVDCK